MTTKSIATALALGFLTFTLSFLPVTTAEAECKNVGSTCPPGWSDKGEWRTKGKDGDFDAVGRVCCTTPSKPITRETKEEEQQREVKECAAMGGRYDPQKTPRCSKRPVKLLKKPKPPVTAEAAAACRKQGNDYNHETGRCVKVLKKDKTQGAPEQAEEQSSSSSDESDEDYKPKKKKKRHYDDDYD